MMTYIGNKNWLFSQWIHLFGAMIYTIDLIRMYSQHCWVFNVPFIVWWICDRLYGIFYYHRCAANIVHIINLDKQYTMLYLRVPEILHLLHSIGDVYCGWDRDYPFNDCASIIW
jgi:hypothetical protein